MRVCERLACARAYQYTCAVFVSGDPTWVVLHQVVDRVCHGSIREIALAADIPQRLLAGFGGWVRPGQMTAAFPELLMYLQGLAAGLTCLLALSQGKDATGESL